MAYDVYYHTSSDKTGVVLKAVNSDTKIPMKYGEFYRLRTNVAKCIDLDFGKVYGDYGLYIQPNSAWERLLNEVIDRKKLDESSLYGVIRDFLMAPEHNGDIDVYACKHLYDYLKDKEINRQKFNSEITVKEKTDYQSFKDLLRECVKFKRNMRWA